MGGLPNIYPQHLSTCTQLHCVVPEKIHTHLMEGHWKFLGGGGVLKAKLKKKCVKINWNFLGGGGVQNKKPSVGGVWIFSGTAHCNVGEASASAISPWLVVHAGFPVSIIT